jgi:hypothetical protein
MTDFIDVLEQQLVAAHLRPERRRLVALPWRATIVFAGAVTAAAAVVIAVLALASPSPRPAASGPPTQPPQTTPVTPRARVSLAVINGTKVSGLARGVADKLVSLGYDQPNVVSNDPTNPSRTRTTVYFEHGHRADALGVASCLHIGSDRVVAMDARARALADRARVAIFVGYHRAR